jgi:hypothetical protein
MTRVAKCLFSGLQEGLPEYLEIVGYLARPSKHEISSFLLFVGYNLRLFLIRIYSGSATLKRKHGKREGRKH